MTMEAVTGWEAMTDQKKAELRARLFEEAKAIFEERRKRWSDKAMRYTYSGSVFIPDDNQNKAPS